MWPCIRKPGVQRKFQFCTVPTYGFYFWLKSNWSKEYKIKSAWDNAVLVFALYSAVCILVSPVRASFPQKWPIYLVFSCTVTFVCIPYELSVYFRVAMEHGYESQLFHSDCFLEVFVNIHFCLNDPSNSLTSKAYILFPMKCVVQVIYLLFLYVYPNQYMLYWFGRS